jgi:hypothetical protein
MKRKKGSRLPKKSFFRNFEYPKLQILGPPLLASMI